MESNEQNVAIAKFCGKCVHGPSDWVREGTDQDSEIVCGICRKDPYNGRPNYTKDLNAIHEAWLKFDRKQRVEYSKNLRKVIVDEGFSGYNEDIIALCENASSEQRTQAFLMTIGKEKE
jgi:hypothetical protein